MSIIQDELLIARLAAQRIETQSWGYVSTGTRFKVFHTPGTARNVYEKIDDAALVHELTGISPTVALHIPWDEVDDYAGLARYATEKGVAIGSISPNLFQSDEYRFGSITNTDAGIREMAVQHILTCIDIMKLTGSTQLSLWFADGTNYPGQANFRHRRRYLLEALQTVYDALPTEMTMLLEYKFFEPAFYHTDIADWGQSLLFCQKLGERAKVLVDIGHHALGVNIEHIVATLLEEGRLGGFDLNSKKYADDDLFVGAVNPHELFLIACELVSAEDSAVPEVREAARSVLYKIDQCAMIEDKLPAMIRSIMAMQTAFAKALLVDREELQVRQLRGDVIGSNQVIQDAYDTDVRPLLATVRKALGVSADPYETFRTSDEQATRNATRLGTPAGW